MRKNLKPIILSLLMLALSLSVATNSLNSKVDTPTFEETVEPFNVILPLADLNVPGHQEGSIFTDTTLSSGSSHTCAILDNGSVSCWGFGFYGQLGNGGTSDKTTPTLTSSLGTGRTAVALSSGSVHTCAILDNGAVSCWGRGNYGQLGNGGNFSTASDKTTPTLTSSLGTGRTAVALSSGSYHTCAILDNGLVSCWGFGGNGQLGNGATSWKYTPTLTSSLGTGRTAVAISSGGYHTCAILDNGSVSCWGLGSNGQLGNGGISYTSTPTLTSSLGIGRTAVAISVGNRHSCAILDDGLVKCWGDGNNGQLGNGATSDKTTPTITSTLGTGHAAVALSSEGDHTCAILDNGSVSCWGLGSNGQLGNGGNSSSSIPTLISSLGTGRTAVALSLGGTHTCTILDNGTVSCWGENSDGQLGDGTTSNRNTPTQISSLGIGRTAALSERDFDNDSILNIFDTHMTYLDIREETLSAAPSGVHTCALLDNGSVSCWGRGGEGQLGNGGTSNKLTPTLTSSFGVNRTAISVSSGSYHTCALLDNGSVTCWGQNTNGELGYGNGSSSSTPQLTSSLGAGRTATAISSGYQHTCALLDNGSVSCWGNGADGRLGRGSTSSSNSPILVGSFGMARYAVAIATGPYHNCALLNDGNVSCWGSGNSGQIGNGNTNDQSLPTQTNSLGTGRTAVSVSVGTRHSCAILDDGLVKCWGTREYGAVGDGTSSASGRTSPTTTSSFGTGRTAVAISAGAFFTCVILDNNDISCWGRDSGRLGNGGTAPFKPSPTLTTSIGSNSIPMALSAGGSHTCVALENKSVYCWGEGDNGQIGNGGTSKESSPTQTSNFGTSQNIMIVDGDEDGDGTLDIIDAFPNNPIRSINCNPGQYGRYICADSPVGKYVPVASAMYATDAPAGYFVNQTAQTSAIACSIGTFQSLTGQTSCVDAPIGSYVNQFGQSTPTPCSLGTYQPLTGQSSCDDATVGHYVDQTGQYLELECNVGTYQALTGQSFCDDADAGHYVDQMAQTNQVECDLGTYQALTGQSSCDDADAGHYVDQMAQTNQTECGLGTYQPLTGQSSCDDADAGHYVDQMAQTNQTACDLGTYQSLTGQSSCDDADAGYYVDQMAQTNQTACDLGTYQSLTGQSSCDDANAGHYVDQMAQTNHTECGLGTYQPLTGQNSCDDADAGHYVDQMAQTNQTECGLGTYQPSTGQNSCDDADAGHYVDQVAQTNQTECGLGTYQPMTGQSSCGDSDAGYYVDQMAQTNQTECDLGTYQALTGQNSCDDADAGYYVDQMVQTNQTECGLGTYQPLTGQSSCDDADAGHYVDQMAQTNQTECGLGTYQPSTGQSSCDDADAGHYVDQMAQTNQTACIQGTYNQNISSIDDSSCVPCPDYTSTLSLGSESIAACKLDTDLDGVPDIIDPDDDNDGTIDELDAFELDKTEDTDTDGDGMGDNAQDLLESQEKADSKQSLIVVVLAGLVSVLVCGLVILKRKKNSDSNAVKELPSTANTSPNHIEKPIKIQKPNPSPSVDQIGVMGGDGYEWINFPPNSQTNYYRAPGDKEWILWEN